MPGEAEARLHRGSTEVGRGRESQPCWVLPGTESGVGIASYSCCGGRGLEFHSVLTLRPNETEVVLPSFCLALFARA